MRWTCIFFASIALAQTPPPPAPAPEKPAQVPSAAELMRAAMDKQRAAMATQQDAVRKQAQGAGATLIPWSPPAGGADATVPACDPIAADIVTPLVDRAAKANSLEAKLVNAVIEQESGFRPCAVSPKGAQGLMQLMPQTSGELSVKDVFDPKENIAAGAKYLKQLLDKYKGDTRLALAAYNAGPAAVDAASSVPDIQETRDYVDAILKKIK